MSVDLSFAWPSDPTEARRALSTLQRRNWARVRQHTRLTLHVEETAHLVLTWSSGERVEVRGI